MTSKAYCTSNVCVCLCVCGRDLEIGLWDIFFPGASTSLVFPDLIKKCQTPECEKFTEGQIISIHNPRLLSFIICTTIGLLSLSAIQPLISDHLPVSKPSPDEDFPQLL